MLKRTDPELSIREAFDAGSFESVINLIVEAYGSEISSFLAARLRGRKSDAQEVFSIFAEDLWKGLPGFAWRCSMRTWCYALARNAAVRYATSQGRRDARQRALENMPFIVRAPDQPRTETSIYRKTSVKDRFRGLRERLDIEDQTLLILRVDKLMSWRDLAIALNGDANLEGDALARECARLRKAFERIKAQLRGLAEREGLLSPPE
jgi:RNA polymerase sigma-70 factor (ECF subfamily)